MKLTPDQLHRLIDEVAALVDRRYVTPWMIFEAAYRAIGPDEAYEWFYYGMARRTFDKGSSGGGHAGLSAVLILLSEGG